MTESIKNEYKRLFEIRLLHHYWLDEGNTVFDLIPQEQRDKRLLSYDIRSFLAISPTAATTNVLSGLRCEYRNTALGCVVAVPNGTKVPVDMTVEFIVTVLDSAFYNYTALTLRPQKIYEIYHQSENKIYRYKENVPLLSNVTGAARGTGVNKTLFLSKEIPALTDDDQVESLVLSGNALSQLTSDQPHADLLQFNALATDLPVFVHQGDVPAIVPPLGLVGAPPTLRGIQLTEDIPDSVFALIRLGADRPDDKDFSFIDSKGHAKTPCRAFQVRLKNRSTIWKYFNKNTRDPVPTDPKPLPLTHWGNAGSKQKPSEGLVKVEKDIDRIIQLVSEIYV